MLRFYLHCVGLLPSFIRVPAPAPCSHLLTSPDVSIDTKRRGSTLKDNAAEAEAWRGMKKMHLAGESAQAMHNARCHPCPARVHPRQRCDAAFPAHTRYIILAADVRDIKIMGNFERKYE